MGQPRLFISAGDPSGDNAVARVAACLRTTFPALELVGLGGPRLAGLGQRQLARPEDIAVLGFWEVARRYPYFRRLFHACLDEIKQHRPNAVVLVDYPGFNLRLAAQVKKLGIPVIYYVAPQVWAWGRGRLRLMRNCVDRLLVILPFEESFFKDHGIDCTFVGHYLLEDIPPQFIASPLPGGRTLALLPGSRRQEVHRMLGPMLDAAGLICRRHGWQATLAAIRSIDDYEAACARHDASSVAIRYDDARRAMYEADLVLTASGTATLEAGIIGRPMVVVYKTGLITYQIARQLVTLDRIALVNLVLGSRVVPELVQGQATPERMASELERYLADVGYREQVQEKLRAVPSLLGGSGASQRAADEIARFL